MRTLLFLVLIAFVSCKQEDKALTAQQIIDKSIEVNGANTLDASILTFDFRNRNYKATRNQGKFELERTIQNDTLLVHDVLSNNDFVRHINTKKIHIPDSMKTRYSGSVNSVHYFSILPYGLNDLAVHKKRLEDVTINDEAYYKIEVRFSEEGGGEDFEDVFIYWIGKEDFKMDFLAYSYLTNGGGKRFRLPNNERIINGVRFLDFDNYKPKNASTKLENLDKAFENSELEKLSEINLENISVEFIQ